MDPHESPTLAAGDLSEREVSKASATYRAVLPAAVLPELPSRASLFSRLLTAGKTGGLAIIGQMLFAGSHFISNILLARWLAPEKYGAFALAYSCFLLVVMLYCACIYEPLIVYGSGRYLTRFKIYLKLLLSGNVIILMVLALAMIAIAVVLRLFYPVDVSRAFLMLAVVAPFILTTWLGRAGFYAQLKPGKAALGGAIYCGTVLGCLFILYITNHLSPPTAFLAMGIAGLLANLFFRGELRRGAHDGPASLTLGIVMRDHWNYGRWAMASAIVAWFPDNIYYTLLSTRAGLEGVAGLRALINLVSPLIQTLTALAGVLIPTLVRHLTEGGTKRLTKAVNMLLAVLLPCSILYVGTVWMYRTTLIGLLYAGKYMQYSSTPVFVIASLPICVTATMVLGAGLRALEKPEYVFCSYIAGTLSAGAIGIPLALHAGVAGAAIGLLVSNVVTAVAMTWSLHHATVVRS